jgi:hypothetical protein
VIIRMKEYRVVRFYVKGYVAVHNDDLQSRERGFVSRLIFVRRIKRNA